MRRMHMVSAGVALQRSVVGWVGVINGHGIVVHHHTRGLYRWSVGRVRGGPLSPVYGRGTTMQEALTEAKTCSLLAPATAQEG